MQLRCKYLLLTLLTLFLCLPVWAGDPAGNASASPDPSLTAPIIKADGEATLSPALLGLLVMKGVLTSDEANTLRTVPAASGMPQLLNILKDKGVVTDADVAQISSANMQPVLLTATASPASAAPAPPEAGPPPVIPAVAPLRVLPIDIPKPAGIIPDLKLGSGANIKVYGFFKASAVSETASSGGPTFGSQDWPLPLLLGATGPTSDPQIHIKARSFRIGAQAEWVPKGSDFTLTGRVEGDFEGDYTNVNNRNISSARSSQFGVRVAWVRLDHKIGNLPWFAEFGQDWALVSSTLPSLFETTGLGIGMGSLWERVPQFKTGLQFHSGDFKFQPEFAMVLPIAGSSALTVDQRLRFGDRAGSESNQPGVEARVVFQFPLNRNWKGVVPAQVIFSGHHARINEIIPAGNQVATSFTCTALPCTVPTPLTNLSAPNTGFSRTTIIGSTCANPAGCALSSFFPAGTQVDDPQNIWTAEVQLPTPWVTLAAKYYRGSNMRFFFAGQLNDVYSNLHGLGEVGNGISFSGRTILMGCTGGVPDPVLKSTFDCPSGNPVLPAILEPSAGSGGFGELSFPLSRIFQANPEGHNSGWVLHLAYSTDRAKYSDAQHGNGLGRTDLDTASITYRLNKWVTFVHEVSYIATFTANEHHPDGTITRIPKVFAGKDVFQAHNWRNEFGPVFTF